MTNSKHAKKILIGAVAALVVAGSAASALAQARAYPQMANCMSPQSATQRQVCTMQREPFYQSDDRIVPKQDNRLQMNMDNGGGGTQAPVVPNTTGAPAITGGSSGLGS
jgi:hypothetical protein